jgi:hypothetical protein
MIKVLRCLSFYLAIGNIIHGESMREKTVPDLKMVKHMEDTTVIRMKRDQEEAEVECADDIKTKVTESIKCSKDQSSRMSNFCAGGFELLKILTYQFCNKSTKIVNSLL